MDFTEAIAYLDRHINREVVVGAYEGLSLDSMEALMAAMAEPHRQYGVIHVTGSKGKGSTATMIASLLQASGLRVGTYLSPHVSSITERIRHNGEAISEDDFGEVISSIANYADLLDHDPSYFELLTAAAFEWFADIAVDVAVVEVGVLGRFDATNVVSGDVAVVTTIGSDHAEGFDGSDEQRQRHVASEKAGIIEAGAPLVLGRIDDDLLPTFAAESPGSILRLGAELNVTNNQLAVGGRLLDIATTRGLYDDVFLGIHGAHQGDNAAVAIAAVEAFFDRALTDDVVAEAFAEVDLPGRAEVALAEPLVLLDAAHSPESASAIARMVRDDFASGDQRYLILGCLQGRDLAELLRAFEAPLATMVIACAPDSPRAVPAAELGAAATALGCTVEVVSSVAAATERALSLADVTDLVLISGSFYTVGEARAFFLDQAAQDSQADQ